MVYGVWNARNPQVQRYELNIAKKAVNQQQLRIVMVSDIHLGSIVNSQRLTYLADMVNQLKPDLVLLAGDMLEAGSMKMIGVICARVIFSSLFLPASGPGDHPLEWAILRR